MIEYLMIENKDLLELVDLRIQMQKEDWDDEYSVDDGEFRKTTLDFLNVHMNKDIFFFVAKRENIIVATCGIQIINYLPQCNDLTGRVGYICNVYTISSERGKGIQKYLFQECLNFAQKEGINIFELSTGNPKAISLYKQFGFKIDKNHMQKGKEQ